MILCITVIYICNTAINAGTSWLAVPIWIIILPWLAISFGTFVNGKNKITAILLCGFTIFTATFFYSSLNNAPIRDFSNFDGFTKTYLPHYTVIISLLVISAALCGLTVLVAAKKIPTSVSVYLILAGVTILILSVITVSAIVDFVDLNGYGVDGTYTKIQVLSDILAFVSIAILVRRSVLPPL
jgi:hypothetical protein